MSAVPKKRYSPEEYLALEAAATYKSEYYQGEIFAMAGATATHVKISGNLFYALKSRLGKAPCQPLANDMLIKVQATGLMAYPDVIVVCGEEQYADAAQRVLLNPTLLIEVLSDTTEKYDRRVKVRQYQRIPSVQEIVLVSQEEPHIERFHRMSDNTWTHSFHTGFDGQLPLASVAVELPLSEVYDRIEFPM